MNDKKQECIICGKSTSRRRKRCGACNTKIRRYRCKIKAIQYLGGKCVRCGFDGHHCAYEFHHVNPETKKFAIGSCANKSWKVLVAELDKCELLCSNCHRIEHSNRDEEKFLVEAVKYNYTAD